MDETKKVACRDARLTRILERLEEMDRLVEQLPKEARPMGEAAVARIRNAVQPVLEALKWRQ